MTGCNCPDVSTVIKKNLEFYDKIKPKDRGNTYTVIATLNDVKSGQLIALATGTQASLKVYGDDIEDCHAESLLKRAYKRYLIDAALKIRSERVAGRAKSATGWRSVFLDKYGHQGKYLATNVSAPAAR